MGGNMERDETTELTQTLLSSLSVIAESDDQTRLRIRNTYRSGLMLSAHFALTGDDARPGIRTCLAWYRAASEANEAASIGWLLAAIDERINARDLRDWQALQKLLDDAHDCLQPTHH